MKLTAGVRLGPYEILAPIGAGGMGEVYRARDTRLDRVVAIKILPDHLSSRPDARERFEREARAISSLNHPNVCHLYDIGAHDGASFLVMEFLEGESLADRLSNGPLPLDQALRIGVEICEGLEQAHRTGVVHRDLKPGNIMLTASGAKLVDFGLAKPSAPALGSSAGSMATVARPLTAEGAVVGTMQYMSPEQIEGKDADARSDIFALGAVLYESVAGRRPFDGRSQISIASAILEKDPEPISINKPMTPPALEHVIRTCLAKDPEKRWQSSRDLGHALRWIAEGGAQPAVPAAAPGRGRTRLLLAALGAMAAVALILALILASRPPAAERVTRTYIKPMPDSSFIISGGAGFALSPDGRSLAYVATAPAGKAMLWIRPIDSLQARPLAGTEGATYPFWSPDSNSIGFFAGAKLKKVDAAGTPPFTLCDASDGRGGAWNGEGVILFTPGVNAPLYRISASGGTPTAVTALNASRHELSHRWPGFLPDGRHFIYMAGSSFSPRENPTNSIMLGSMDSTEGTVLFHSHAGAVYASGHILFLRLDTLMAQPFDPDRLELAGEPVPVADPVHEESLYSRGLFTASDNGLLAFLEGASAANRQLLWLDRSGHQAAVTPEFDSYASPRLSPDGTTLLFYLDGAGQDVWTLNVARGIKSPQTFGSASAQSNLFPVWSPDGAHIAYSSFRNGEHIIYQKPADGSSKEEVLLGGGDFYRFTSDWSPDGKVVAYQQATAGGWSIWMIPVDGGGKPWQFLPSSFSEREASFSPDGKWVAYCSNESGEYKVYAVPFPGPGGKWQISSGGGGAPRWRRDGREIFYLSPDNKLMSVEVSARGSSLEVATARALFETRAYGAFNRFDVTADGQRFVIPYEAGLSSTAIALAANWTAPLKH